MPDLYKNIQKQKTCMEQLFHVGINALIMNNKKQILVLKANPNELKQGKAHWDLPGGRIKEGDSVEQTMKREIEEELGIDGNYVCSKLFDASVSNLMVPIENNKKVGLVLMTYLCSLKTKEQFTLSEEHTECKWASVEETKQLLSFKFSPLFVKKLGTLPH